MNKTLKLLIVLSALALMKSAFAVVSVPDTIDYQGRVLDSTSNPLSPGTPANYKMTFRIFPDSSGGSPLWTETQIVTVINGQFSVRLGEGLAEGSASRPPLKEVFTSSSRYLGLTVEIPGQPGTPAEISPRLAFLSTPFAYASDRANKADLADRATVADQVNQTTGTSNLGFATIDKATVSKTLDATGTVTAGAFSTSGKVSAGSFAGDGSLLTNVAMPDIIPKDLTLTGKFYIDTKDSGMMSTNLLPDNIYINPTTGASEIRSFVKDGISLFGKSGGYLMAKTTDGSTLQPVLEWTNTGKGGLLLSRPDMYNGIDPSMQKYRIYLAGAAINTSAEFRIECTNEFAGGYFFVNSSGDFGKSSDRRLKKDIQNMPPTLGSVLGLRPVTYHMKADPTGSGTRPSYGFIAQEVQEVLPDVVSAGGSDGLLAIVDSAFSSIIVRAIQEFHDETERNKQTLEEEIGSLRTENSSLQRKVDDLESRLLKLEAATK